MGVELPGEAVAHLETSPGRIELRLRDLNALLDRETRPTYPHTSPVVEGSVAKFLLTSAREQRGQPSLTLVVSLGSSPLGADEEVAARTHLSRFFANEAELASLDLRVNRREGLGSLQFAVPLVVIALLVAGLLYSQLGTLSGAGYLDALSYLVFITIVWVMLWDPVEVLLFDSYFIRSRVRACRKLANASVEFAYRTDARSGIVAKTR